MVVITVVSAQPVFTVANSTPVYGPTDISHATQYVAAAPATANFNFNVGALTMGAGSSGTVVQASSTPYASTFPNATYAATPGFGFYTFSSVSPTAVNYWGFAFDDANGAVRTFDVSSVPRGMYIVRVQDAQGRSSNMSLVLH